MLGDRGPDWGVDFGEEGEIPPDAVSADSDTDAARIVADARRAGRTIPPVVLTGGDMARTLGVAPARAAPTRPAATGARFKVDVGSGAGGRPAALVRGSSRGSPVVVAGPAAGGGQRLVHRDAGTAAPRSHPGDGRLDVFDASPARCRSGWPPAAACPREPTSRTPTSPSARIAAAQYDFDPALDVYLDGQSLDRARTLSLRVEPGALEVWVPR